MSRKFLAQYCEELQQFDPREVMARVRGINLPAKLKVQLLEGLREELRVNLLQLSKVDRPQKLRKQQNLSTCLTERSQDSEEQDLWQQIDQMEQQIVDARQTKIELHNALQDYEQEWFEARGIRESKRRFNEQLGDQILKKRKKLEVNKSWSYDAEKLSKSFEGAAAYWRESIKHFWN